MGLIQETASMKSQEAREVRNSNNNYQENKINSVSLQLDEKANKSEVTNVMTPKGNLAYASLPTTGNTVGWYYYCPDGDGTHGAGNYVWNGSTWYFGGTGDNGYNVLKHDFVEPARKASKAFYLFFDEIVPVMNGKYIYQDGVTLATSTSGYYTDYVDIIGAEKIVITANISSAGYICAFYDENKSFINSIGQKGEGVAKTYTFDLTNTLYANARYARFSSYNYVPKPIISGKKYSKHYNTFSVIGDSFSSYVGYMADANAGSWYPASQSNHPDNDVNDVAQTWWFRFAYAYGSRLIQNNSWTGSTVSYNGYAEGTTDGKETSFITRRNLVGKSDLILVYGGTNDSWAGAALGSYKYSDWAEDDFQYFRPSLAYLFHQLIRENIGSKIVMMLNDAETIGQPYVDAIETICSYYNIPYVVITGISKTNSHPNSVGMKQISDQLIALMNTTV